MINIHTKYKLKKKDIKEKFWNLIVFDIRIYRWRERIYSHHMTFRYYVKYFLKNSIKLMNFKSFLK